jgi:hypothetical protein
MLHASFMPLAAGGGSLAAEQATQAAEDAAEFWRLAGENVVDHPMVVSGDLRFHEICHGGDRLVCHFFAESEGGELLFEFVHKSRG